MKVLKVLSIIFFVIAIILLIIGYNGAMSRAMLGYHNSYWVDDITIAVAGYFILIIAIAFGIASVLGKKQSSKLNKNQNGA